MFCVVYWCRLIKQTDALTMHNVFYHVDWAFANALKHGTTRSPDLDIFTKNCRFLWGENVSKTNLGSTIHYTYTSYNKYFRLCMVSEELRLNEISLFLFKKTNQKTKNTKQKITQTWNLQVPKIKRANQKVHGIKCEIYRPY